MITFKIISSTSDVENLKTRSHHKVYTVHECCQSQRIGYIMQSTQTFDLQGTLIKSSQLIKSYYFGFPNSAQADKFADFARYKFRRLEDYATSCESRLSKRLKSPFEVKIRSLPDIADELFLFFCQCIDKELHSPKVIDIDHDAMKAKVKRL